MARTGPRQERDRQTERGREREGQTERRSDVCFIHQTQPDTWQGLALGRRETDRDGKTERVTKTKRQRDRRTAGHLGRRGTDRRKEGQRERRKESALYSNPAGQALGRKEREKERQKEGGRKRYRL